MRGVATRAGDGRSSRAEALRAALERRFVTIDEVFTVADTELAILRPRSAEDLISEEDFANDERLPYWADVWPSARILAGVVLESDWPPTRVLELGCGVGLVAAAAMLRGHTVMATDYYEDALAFTRYNALRNTGVEPVVRHLDWRAPPDDLERVPLVLAADVLYERPYASAVADTLARVLEPAGRGVIADPGRIAAPEFLEECRARGLTVATADRHEFRSSGQRQTVTVYSLAASASSSRDLTSSPHR